MVLWQSLATLVDEFGCKCRKNKHQENDTLDVNTLLSGAASARGHSSRGGRCRWAPRPSAARSAGPACSLPARRPRSIGVAHACGDDFYQYFIGFGVADFGRL